MKLKEKAPQTCRQLEVSNITEKTPQTKNQPSTTPFPPKDPETSCRILKSSFQVLDTMEMSGSTGYTLTDCK